MPLTYKQIKIILDDLEFNLVRTNGSHFRFEDKGQGLTIPFHKEFTTKTAKSILKDISKIKGVEYINLIKKYNIKI